MQRMLNVRRTYSAYAQLTRSALASARAPRERQCKNDFISEKASHGVLTTSSLFCYGVHTAFYRVSTEF